uniref:Uncharacterized protein n=1 Tax=Chromera velia CCMP2878 TaxID=1169474 RepID=A0A0K6S6F6_9ALVE|eukprot:Cvel_17363.t1-p1 / transcript=Cvel_17363.t1 / gene=Cvel_17363 / organism=Chromera_velia_CCMP2878 / gene_product=hypothetical protein / transcript_product=hypothetical protein / location=Cvel_scaffold1380:4437-5652(+) / protein_length=186 / sequence_SO=supercontig / SO=protein_coding / is_pseudo=false
MVEREGKAGEMTLQTQSDPVYYFDHEELDIYLEFEDLYDNKFDLPDLVASDDEEDEGMGVDDINPDGNADFGRTAIHDNARSLPAVSSSVSSSGVEGSAAMDAFGVSMEEAGEIRERGQREKSEQSAKSSPFFVFNILELILSGVLTSIDSARNFLFEKGALRIPKCKNHPNRLMHYDEKKKTLQM